MIRENQRDLFEFQKRQKEIIQEDENLLVDSSEDSRQQLLNVQKKQVRKRTKLDRLVFSFVLS